MLPCRHSQYTPDSNFLKLERITPSNALPDSSILIVDLSTDSQDIVQQTISNAAISFSSVTFHYKSNFSQSNVCLMSSSSPLYSPHA